MMKPLLAANGKTSCVHDKQLSCSDKFSNKDDLVIDARFIAEDGGINSKEGNNYTVFSLTTFPTQGMCGKLCSLMILLERRRW
mmetsp:Transcript_1777/g.2883  ORF Transcript_1777/g.2883 Transcript_1777/m.2883 type:complete len:83 (-) Transcript_1777:144-392(-)